LLQWLCKKDRGLQSINVSTHIRLLTPHATSQNCTHIALYLRVGCVCGGEKGGGDP